jgi:DNA-binding MarR family transcriptional regulator
MAGVLARMEDLDLVTRSRIPADQRRVMIRLTAKSLGIAERMAPLIDKQYRYLEQAYGAGLITQLYEVLDQIVLAEPRAVQHVDLSKISAS